MMTDWHVHVNVSLNLCMNMLHSWPVEFELRVSGGR